MDEREEKYCKKNQSHYQHKLYKNLSIKKIKTTSEKKMKFSSKNVSHSVFFLSIRQFHNFYIFFLQDIWIYFFQSIWWWHTQTHKTFWSLIFFHEFSAINFCSSQSHTNECEAKMTTFSRETTNSNHVRFEILKINIICVSRVDLWFQ